MNAKQPHEIMREIDSHVQSIQGDIREIYSQFIIMEARLSELRSEVNCRIEHGAESGGHLEYVQSKLDEILEGGAK